MTLTVVITNPSQRSAAAALLSAVTKGTGYTMDAAGAITVPTEDAAIIARVQKVVAADVLAAATATQEAYFRKEITRAACVRRFAKFTAV